MAEITKDSGATRSSDGLGRLAGVAKALSGFWDRRSRPEKIALGTVGGAVVLSMAGATAYAIATGGAVVAVSSRGAVVAIGAASRLYRHVA